MTNLESRQKTSSGFFVTKEAPIDPENPLPTPTSEAPDILRCASMELVVTDLAVSREFYVDVLGLVVTEEDEETVYLRSMEEFIHHNLVLRQGETAAVAAFSYRVRAPEDLDKAVAFYEELGCRVERRKDGFVKGVGDSVRFLKKQRKVFARIAALDFYDLKGCFRVFLLQYFALNWHAHNPTLTPADLA